MTRQFVEKGAGEALGAEGVGPFVERQLSGDRRGAALVARIAPLPSEAQLAVLLEGAPPRTVALALRHRYVALALALNLPGNAVIGGGGGIMLMARLSRLFAPWPTVFAVIVTVSQVVIAVMLLGA